MVAATGGVGPGNDEKGLLQDLCPELSQARGAGARPALLFHRGTFGLAQCRFAGADPISAGDLTATCTVMVPAFAKVRVSGKVSPCLSGSFKSISMMCIPPGRRPTVSPAGTSITETCRMRITS